MDANMLTELISAMGFPIMATIGVGIFCYKMVMLNMEQGKERESKLLEITREISQQSAELGRIVEENTKMIAVMSERLEQLANDIEGIKRGE